MSLASARVALLAPVLGAVAAALFGCGSPSSKDAAPKAPESAALASAVWFEDVAAANGVDFRHVSGHREKPLFPEIMGGGGALFDMDGDQDLDLFLVQSGSLYEPNSESARDRLYRNRGDGTFEDVTNSSGIDEGGYGMGAAVGDYDDDGDPDVFVTNFGPDALWRNDGKGRFTDVTREAGVGDPAWGTSTTFTDLDADGDLDLYIANYVHWTMETEIECPNPLGRLDYCLPTNYEAPARDTLYRNEGDGTFTDVSREAGLGSSLAYGLGVVSTDFDGDSRLDVFVANDSVLNQLWMNRGGLRFENEALLRGCAVDENGNAKAGMGVMAIDFDDDADRDVLVVNLWKQSDSYYENENGYFADKTARVGLGVASRAYTRFGMGFQDFDCDGRLDLFLANGRVTRDPDPVDPDPYAEPNLLLRGLPDGTLAPVETLDGTREPRNLTSRAALFGDVDGDGGVDVVVVNRDGPVQVLRNVRAGRGNWILFAVRETSGRDALGAVVTATIGARTVTRDVLSGYSYCAANDPRVHLGLGNAAHVDDIVVTWIGGERERFGGFDANQQVTLRRGAGKRVP